jgi:hypothetical protein
MKKYLVICLFLLTACSDQEFVDHINKNIIYFKDFKSELCFAMKGRDSKTLTNVPCDKVEKLLVNNPSKQECKKVE